jgi:hypothetical protein
VSQLKIDEDEERYNPDLRKEAGYASKRQKGGKSKGNGKSKDEIQGSLHCGGKVRRLRSR